MIDYFLEQFARRFFPYVPMTMRAFWIAGFGWLIVRTILGRAWALRR